MKASVIMSTYNAEAWLEKVLWGFSIQTENDFEIIIADDGSTDATKTIIEAIANEIKVSINHVWQEDNGFQKTQILNKAILEAKSDYLIFTDGDCIPRKDFVEAHLKFREKKRFLSGGYFKLPLSVSDRIRKEDVVMQNCFSAKWLQSKGVSIRFKMIKFLVNDLVASLLNAVTTTKPSWNGHNASGWKDDCIAINGFNEDMQYGGEDREFGERLQNFGIKPKQIRYSAICVHLEHERNYANEASKAKNLQIRKHNKENKTTRIANGIFK